MFDLNAQSEAFKAQYEKFLTACDALEENGDWKKATQGDMETYYFNGLMCAALHLISADGLFSDEEADYINAVLGFHYSADELSEIYRTEKTDIDQLFTSGIPEDYRQLKKEYPEMAELYKTMLLQLCELIAASDGYVLENEKGRIAELKKNLQA